MRPCRPARASQANVEASSVGGGGPRHLVRRDDSPRLTGGSPSGTEVSSGPPDSRRSPGRGVEKARGSPRAGTPGNSGPSDLLLRSVASLALAPAHGSQCSPFTHPAALHYVRAARRLQNVDQKPPPSLRSVVGPLAHCVHSRYSHLCRPPRNRTAEALTHFVRSPFIHQESEIFLCSRSRCDRRRKARNCRTATATAPPNQTTPRRAHGCTTRWRSERRARSR